MEERDIKDILLQKRTMTGILLGFVAWFFFMYGNFKYGKNFFDYSWWIISFNLLILVTLAVSTFRKGIYKHDQKTQKAILNSLNQKLKDELKEEDIDKKKKIHDDLESLYQLSKIFPKSLVLRSLTSSILLSVAYIISYAYLGQFINQKIWISNLILPNIILIGLFLSSFYYLIKAVINIIWFFKY